MDRSDRKAIALTVIVGISILLFVVIIGWSMHAVKSYFEAEAYNRITGSHVTTWDAMFVDLRVQAEPKPSGTLDGTVPR